ncbi:MULTISPECIES: SHOCT domain-containing protein [unclassified Streptomyces]|uniref:SHOCT domain-containing protein n=1 Tax=unclassified Streptomyces TaxID=2593676 RepID=UPI00278C195F|nr:MULTISPECIES: SHOCT domain-containing protein [unclassified Streptomyces]
MPQRFGRPGLLGTVVRTAAISATHTAVSGGVRRRQADRAMRRDMEAQAYQQQPYQEPTAYQQPAPQAASAPGGTDRVSQLTALADLRAQGLLTDEEFAREKARVLGN